MHDSARKIIETLMHHGHQAYLVGGCVRDHIMGLAYHDIDIATSALPQEVMTYFDKTLPTGIDYGTITVVENGEAYEVTTFRKDLDYTDGRRPKAVAFSKDIREDLARRDFTINAMAMTAEGQVIDPFGGQEDIKKGLVRCVGQPDLRFKEDALRKLRAIRFAVQKGFDLEEATAKAIQDQPGLRGVSPERLRDEFDKILGCDHLVRGLDLLFESRLLEEMVNAKLLPPVVGDPAAIIAAYPHNQTMTGLTANKKLVGWTLLFDALVSVGEASRFETDLKTISAACRALKFSKNDQTKLLSLLRWRQAWPNPEEGACRRWLYDLDDDLFDSLVWTARWARTPYLINLPHGVDHLLNLVEDLKRKGIFTKTSPLCLNGHDLMGMFQSLASQPAKLGGVIHEARMAVCYNPSLNTPSALKAWLKQSVL